MIYLRRAVASIQLFVGGILQQTLSAVIGGLD